MTASDMFDKLLKNNYLSFAILILLMTTGIIKSEEVVIEIDNPRFSEKGLNDKTYEIKAERGLKYNNELQLFKIEGKFKTMNNGKWIYLEADKGNFYQNNNFIELEENIVFYTDDGEKLTSNHATFDIANDTIKLKENVNHESKDGLIISDSSIISNSFNKILYKGNVVSTIKTRN